MYYRERAKAYNILDWILRELVNRNME